jgi:tetratricopeptide (TPR) repeat protein
VHERNNVWADQEAFWKDCIAKAPSSPRPYSSLAGIYLERNQLGLAFQYLTRAIELDNNYSLAYLNLGIIYKRQQKHDQALYYYKEALRTSRADKFKILTNMGNVYYAKGEMLTAETYYRQALQSYDDFLAHLGLGFIYGQQNRCQEAIYHFQVALAKAAGNMRARYESLTGLGHCTNQLGNTQAAISYYQQALQIQPNSPDIARKLQRLMQKK